MPNYCINKLTIKADAPVIDEIHRAAQKVFIDDLPFEGPTLSGLLGMDPELLPCMNDSKIVSYDDNSITLFFITEWLPPVEFLGELIFKYDLTLKCIFYEPDWCQSGYYKYDKKRFQRKDYSKGEYAKRHFVF